MAAGGQTSTVPCVITGNRRIYMLTANLITCLIITEKCSMSIKLNNDNVE